MIVITSLTNYSVEDIRPYVESLNNVGFGGRKIVLYYNPEMSVYRFLKENGWEIYTYDEPNYFITFQRLKDVPELLRRLGIRNESICFTDIRDVHFEKTPSSIKVDFYIGADAFVSIKDHEWNANAIFQTFPEYYEKVKFEVPLCAGVIIGDVDLIYRLFTDSYKLGLNRKDIDLKKWSPIDQSAINVMAYTKYRNILQLPTHEDRIVLNMANLGSSNPEDIDGYHIYHQYNRIENFNFPR